VSCAASFDRGTQVGRTQGTEQPATINKPAAAKTSAARLFERGAVELGFYCVGNAALSLLPLASSIL